jgi:hypothetical protein
MSSVTSAHDSDRLATPLKCMIYSYLKLRDHIRLSSVSHTWLLASRLKESKPLSSHYSIKIPIFVDDLTDMTTVWLKRLKLHRPRSLTLSRYLFYIDINDILVMKDTLRSLSVDIRSCREHHLMPFTFLTSLTIRGGLGLARVPSDLFIQFQSLSHFHIHAPFASLSLHHLPASLTSLELGGEASNHRSEYLLELISTGLLNRLHHLSMRLPRLLRTDKIWLALVTSPSITSLHYALDGIPLAILESASLPRLKRIALDQRDRAHDNFMITLSVVAPNITSIDDMVTTKIRSDHTDLKVLPSFKSLTKLSLQSEHNIATLVLPKSLSHILVDLRLVCSTDVTYEQLSRFTQLTTLALASPSIFPLPDPLLINIPQWLSSSQHHGFPCHPHLPHISITTLGKKASEIIPFLASIPAPSSPSVASTSSLVVVSSSSPSLFHGSLRVFNTADSEKWIRAGLDTSFIQMAPKDHDSGLFD